MVTGKHPNSKIVTLKRKVPFGMDIRDPEVLAWLDTGKVSVGSYFNSTGRGNATGLNDVEIKMLLPSIVSVSSNDLTFRKAVSEYYGKITTRIPAKGQPLEIGLELDNEKPITFSKPGPNGSDEIFNLPINVEQYIAYRHAIGHPHTRLSEEEADSDPTSHYYIDDPINTTDRLNKENDLRDEAMAAYLEIKKDKKSINMVLKLLKLNLADIPQSDRAIRLKKAMEDDPKTFKEVATDPQLAAKYEISQMISKGIIMTVGNQPRYLDAESKVELAQGIDDMLMFMNDKSNSESVLLLKSKLQSSQKTVKESTSKA